MDNHAKNQHYVPQALLKNFASKSSMIWTFDKQAYSKNWKFIKERPISRVASEEYFYDLIPNVKSTSYEYAISEIEKKATPIIRQIIELQDLILSNEEKITLSLFIARQYIRTKYRQSILSAMTTEMNDKLQDFFPSSKLLDDARIIWLSLFNDIELFAEAICNKEWFLGFCNSLFYTSDNPVVLQNSANKSEVRGTLGLESYGIEIYIPLNSSILLCMFCPELLKQFQGKFTLEKFNYQNVLNVNALQFFQSERFIFNDKNEFGMITKRHSEVTIITKIQFFCC